MVLGLSEYNNVKRLELVYTLRRERDNNDIVPECSLVKCV